MLLWDTEISQGSVATHLRCDWIFRQYYYKLYPDSDSEKSSKM